MNGGGKATVLPPIWLNTSLTLPSPMKAMDYGLYGPLFFEVHSTMDVAYQQYTIDYTFILTLGTQRWKFYCCLSWYQTSRQCHSENESVIHCIWLNKPYLMSVAVLTYKVLHGSAPRYLEPLAFADLHGRHTLCSCGTSCLMLPSVRHSTDQSVTGRSRLLDPVSEPDFTTMTWLTSCMKLDIVCEKLVL